MIYSLTDLLMKMGAPEVREKSHIEWHYFNKAGTDIAGLARIELANNGEKLVATLKNTKENYQDDNGRIHDNYTETFLLEAQRTLTPGQYKLTKIAFDGDEYPHPTKAIIELGLSVFHARALDISILMVEQAFNKRDILDPITDPFTEFRNKVLPKVEMPQKQSAVIIPFRSRKSRMAANAL